jgi:type VI secretion system protein ImpD/type VI secretion system protein ImpC
MTAVNAAPATDIAGALPSVVSSFHEEETASPALRDAVLAGRFIGNVPAASDLAAFVAAGDPCTHLRLWFGTAWLRALRPPGARTRPARPDGAPSSIWSAPGASAARDPRVARLRAALDRDIARLDEMISAQLDAILQHPRLRRLEGSWRGLRWLTGRLPAVATRVRLKVLQARWIEVCRDIERAIEFDQSHLFRKIHEEEFGMAGGEPFGLIACDYEIRHRPGLNHPTDDVGALSGLAGIAAAAFSPMILSASPEMLGLDSFCDMSPTFDPGAVLRDQDHQRWRTAASQEDLRFIGIALPRMLARPPWPDDGSRADGFRYRGLTRGADQRVWTSPVYGFAAVVMRAFERYSWPAEVRGADVSDDARGGVLEDLPHERFPSDLPFEPPARAPLEVALTDEQENRISEAGLIPLSALDGLPEACFGALPSLHKPPRFSSAVAETNQRLSSQLNTLLCVSRFAHCVKFMGRDMIGSYKDPVEVETVLQKWLNQFIGGQAVASPETMARYPLQEARVEVRERSGRPGVYNCTVHLMPHHQLDEIGASFRLVTEFSQREAAA